MLRTSKRTNIFTLIIPVLALSAGWLMNDDMQSLWTRDGKTRVRDNQFVKAGTILFQIDDTPFHIAVLNAQSAANNKTRRRYHLPGSDISACRLHGGDYRLSHGQADIAQARVCKVIIGIWCRDS